MKVVHFCSSHSRYDSRVFNKICRSLAKTHNVTYICAEGNDPPSEQVDDVFLVDIGRRRKTKIQRFITTPPKLFIRALNEKADVYHIHDPELIVWGLVLKLLKKKVILDCHELYLDQILDRPYLKYIKYVTYIFWWFFEKISIPFFDSVICATDKIYDHFSKLNKSTYTIYNYPLIEEFSKQTLINNNFKKNGLIYLGGITAERGIKNIVKAMEHVDDRLHLVGPFVSKEFHSELQELNGWKKVIWHGPLDRNESISMLQKSKIGLINFLPKKNHIDSLPNKIFEYLAAGLHVCASDFIFWKNFFNIDQISYSDPEDPLAIAENINNSLKMVDDSSAVKAKYFAETHSWLSQEKKLLEIYTKIYDI